MTRNSVNIYSNAMGHAGGNGAAIFAASLADFLVRLPHSILRTLSVWQQRSRDRARLGMLDTRLIRDMGMSSEDVALEISKPFWRS